MSLSWKPKRKGDIYCAPACGGDCKYSDYKKATDKAKALCKKLGNGFTARVWENCGWYYEAVNGKIKVHPSRHCRNIGDYGVTYQNAIWFHSPDPKTALRELLEWAEAQRNESIDMCEEIAEAIK